MPSTDIKHLLDQVHNDELRNDRILHLTANEPAISKTASSFLSSSLTNRYYFGGGDEEGVVDFDPSSFLGLKGVESLVNEAMKSTAKLLSADSVNLSCLSGLHAMTCSIVSVTEPGDCIMSIRVEDGGHFSTSTIIHSLGRTNVFASYNQETLSFEPEQIAKTVNRDNVKALYLDASFYINPHNLKEIRSAVGEDLIIIYDASHTMGLILGQEFQQPLLEGADIITANTHKTLPGPQKGMLAMRNEQLSEKVNGLIGGGLISSPHTAEMIALSITLLEMRDFGREYANATINNTRALGEALTEKGYEVRSSNTGTFSNNHQLHVFTDTVGNYRDLYKYFIQNNISVNFSNALGGRMFIRLGTQEITRRGMGLDEMVKISEFIDASFKSQNISSKVEDFSRAFKKVHYSYDD